MRFKLLVTVLALFTTVSMAFGDEVDNRFQKARKYLRENKVTITTTIEQAYSQDAVLVMGEGAPKKGTTGSQKRLTAITAAKNIAYRRLAEMLEGIAIVSETTVKDSELVSDSIKSAVTGFIKGAQVVQQEWNEHDETALVIVRVGMSGPKSFASVMYDKILTEPKIKGQLDKPVYAPPIETPATPANPPTTVSKAFDGLIIDATEQNFRPALINRIFTQKGDVLYDPAKISQKVLVEQGCGEYTNSVAKAKAALGKRGVKNPLVVKASGTISPSDLQVGDTTVKEIYSANQTSGFMADARVAFVLK